MTNNRTPWTAAENMALAALYFSMLDRQAEGRSYSKAASIRIARAEGREGDVNAAAAPFARYANQLKDRTRGSIEAKLMNASAAHRDAIESKALPERETMDGHGYRAMSNYQATLRGAIITEGQRRIEDYYATSAAEYNEAQLRRNLEASK